MRFDYTISHVPGKLLTIADALSRAPVGIPTDVDEGFTEETSYFVQAIVKSLPISDQRLQAIKCQQERDETCKLIASYCQSGWPEKKELPSEAIPFYHVASELFVTEGLLMRQNRIIIPAELRSGILKEIHSGHQGVSKCRDRARQSVWWPRLSSDLEELINNCAECRKASVQRPEPLISSTLPELP